MSTSLKLQPVAITPASQQILNKEYSIITKDEEQNSQEIREHWSYSMFLCRTKQNQMREKGRSK